MTPTTYHSKPRGEDKEVATEDRGERERREERGEEGLERREERKDRKDNNKDRDDGCHLYLFL
jgi:hypothetical protein